MLKRIKPVSMVLLVSTYVSPGIYTRLQVQVIRTLTFWGKIQK